MKPSFRFALFCGFETKLLYCWCNPIVRFRTAAAFPDTDSVIIPT